VHADARAYVARVLPKAPTGPVVEFGSRFVNGGVRDLLNGAPYVGIDQEPGLGVDVVADARSFRAETPAALVLCCEVLEHCPRPEQVIANAYANLARGGRLILTAAADPRAPHSGLDGQQLRLGEYYANIAAWQLQEWLKPFHRYEIEESHTGDIYAWAEKA
jgi:SAM-dependent methyltransferase